MQNQALVTQAVPYVPQIDNYNAIEAFIRRVYNPSGDPSVDARTIIQPFAYPVTLILPAAGTPAQSVIQISANADFILTDLTYTAFDTTTPAADVVPAATLTLTDIGSQQPLTSQPVLLPAYCAKTSGVGGSARPFTFPRIISGRSGLQVQGQNIGADVGLALAYRVFLNFIGVQVYIAGMTGQG